MVHRLLERGHEVLALTRRADAVEQLFGGRARPVLADVLDRDGLLRAVDGLAADAVVHQLTALRKPPTTLAKAAATNRLRDEGTTRLLEAAVAVGARRVVAQSFFGGYGYLDHGPDPVSEQGGFAPSGTRFEPVLAALRSLERQVCEHPGLDGIALRYGLFYTGGDLPEQVRRRGIPVTAQGGVLPMVHHEDAAEAAVLALTAGRPGAVYNVADDAAVDWRTLFTTMAAAVGGRPPRVLPRWVLRLGAPMAAALMCDTTLRLDSTAARLELGWTPRHPSYREGLGALRAG
jgi:nucleoside-diphosphate-sugar epimerase